MSVESKNDVVFFTKFKKVSTNNKLKVMKEIFLKWSQNVDINCYNKMLAYGPNFKVQFIWLIILLGSTGATFYFISKSVIDYLNHEVVSQTNIVNELPTQFPAVTFCDNNPFSNEKSFEFIVNSIQNNGFSIVEYLKALFVYTHQAHLSVMMIAKV